MARTTDGPESCGLFAAVIAEPLPVDAQKTGNKGQKKKGGRRDTPEVQQLVRDNGLVLVALFFRICIYGPAGISLSAHPFV